MNAPVQQPELRIVIPIVAGIGNALLAVPMVRALKRARPGARITILARIDAMAEVFRRLPEVAETLVTGTGAKGVLRMIAASRRRDPHLCLVPFPSNRWQYALLAATSGARQRVLHGYPVGYWRALHFIGTRVPAVRGIHDVEQNLRLLEAVVPIAGRGSPHGHPEGSGSDPSDLDAGAVGDSEVPQVAPSGMTAGRGGGKTSGEAPVFALTDEDRAGGAALLQRTGVDGPFIVVHAGSARTILAAAKRWPPARYAELVAALRREFDGQIVLLEGPDEAGVADEIRQCGAAGTLLRLAGSLGESAAVLERAALYVGSDSGLAHLSAAVGTRAVTLFAPADPDRVCPYGNRHLVVQAPTPCAPCFLYPWQSARPKMRCAGGGAPLCIEKIEISAVMAAVRCALGRDEPAALVREPTINGASR